MKIETKIKRVEKSLINNNGFTLKEAQKAIQEANECFNLKNYSVAYFIDALLSTYNVKGVER